MMGSFGMLFFKLLQCRFGFFYTGYRVRITEELGPAVAEIRNPFLSYSKISVATHQPQLIKVMAITESTIPVQFSLLSFSEKMK